MKKTLLLALLVSSSASLLAQGSKLSRYVDPFIGTGGHGHTFPGPMLPFGMVQLSPDNGTQGWDWCSGYHYSDSMIAGFSHTHLSGTGIGDLADISVMPSINRKADTVAFRTGFLHKDETASPGYYRVKMNDGIAVELTTGNRVGMHRITFPAGNDAMLRINLGFAINWDKPTDCYIKQINPTTFVGYRKSTGWAKNQQVYFALVLNKPVKQVSLFANKMPVTSIDASGKSVLACLNVGSGGQQLVAKVGISYASIEGAQAALAEVPGWDFDVVRKKAEDAWEKELSKMVIDADEATKKIFYTALYHTCMAPVQFSDARGEIKATDGNRVKVNYIAYSVHSLWDTFRGANPLYTFTQPQLVPNLINSYLSFYDQYGLLPVWDLHFNETNTMTGYHAVPVVADAILKGYKGFDVNKAYEAMKASAMQHIRGTQSYRQYKYVPQDKEGHSVTVTLEYAFDDWCIAQVAKKLGKMDEYQHYTDRSNYFKNLYDPNTGFFRAKNSDGKWVEPFDPMRSEHDASHMYIEGTAWQHTFFVPHNVQGFAQLMGGPEKLVTKLDSLFENKKPMTGSNISSDISGLIGQYAHGNEPSHHIAYMYAVLGRPDRTAQKVRQIMEVMYRAEPDGLSGNEDCGQMSAWYVWSALGMYPMNPASGEYVLGSPLVNKATLELPNGKQLAVVVKNNSRSNLYIKEARLNGALLKTPYVTHAAMLQGGTLELVMAAKP
jgi:predicted alpha-1,2-mannosidase